MKGYSQEHINHLIEDRSLFGYSGCALCKSQLTVLISFLHLQHFTVLQVTLLTDRIKYNQILNFLIYQRSDHRILQ